MQATIDSLGLKRMTILYILRTNSLTAEHVQIGQGRSHVSPNSGTSSPSSRRLRRSRSRRRTSPYPHTDGSSTPVRFSAGTASRLLSPQGSGTTSSSRRFRPSRGKSSLKWAACYLCCVERNLRADADSEETHIAAAADLEAQDHREVVREVRVRHLGRRVARAPVWGRWGRGRRRRPRYVGEPADRSPALQTRYIFY